MILSPFTPIFFPRFVSDGVDCRYTQTFSTSDSILIEIFSDEAVSAYFSNCETEERIEVTFQERVSEGVSLFFAEVTIEKEGTYVLCIENFGTSEPIRITSDNNALSKTTLIQYSNKDNGRRKDAMFVIDGNRKFFGFRVPGGFRQQDFTFAVDNEQFETSDCDIIELYGKESVQKKFTMGFSDGCPIWFGELLNRLLCCDYVYFDGKRYARKGSSAPEITTLQEGVDSFVFTQTLQQINYLYPTIQTLQND